MIFEGIVIHRIPYKERDLIVKLLLRNGQVGSFYVYGGQGGGKHHKPSLFEIGSMMRVLIKEQKKGRENSEIMIASESERLWEASSIRHDIKAFYLVCLYFEIIQKTCIAYHHGASDAENKDHEGLFVVLSNALFFMGHALQHQQFIPHQQLFLFMGKLLFHLGIMPDTEECSFCHCPLRENKSVIFLPADGQFACEDCHFGENEKGFLLRLKVAYQTRFQDYLTLLGTNFSDCDKLLHYFCHQYQLRPLELKSYALLFKT